MKIFTTEQIRKIDEFTINHEPISSIDLMERAAKACCNWIKQNFSKDTLFYLFAGPGNNGGDTWAIARLLLFEGYDNIKIFYLNTGKLSNDCKINKKRLENIKADIIYKLEKEDDLPLIPSNSVIIDGLFGSGLSRPLENLPAQIVRYLNNSKCKIISIDIPSGLFGEDNSKNNKENIIRATWTLTFQFPKLSFLFAENETYVGNWIVLDIGLHKEIINNTATPYYFLETNDIKKILKLRPKFSHKGIFGHSLIIAGSYGMSGAAVLAANACLRAGSGLVTVHIPEKCYSILQTTIPEAIISIDKSKKFFSEVPQLYNYSSIGVGPGLGKNKKTQKSLKELLTHAKVPLVIDADGINILSINKDWLKLLPENTIITPHPGEFDRLTEKHSNGFDRHISQIELSKTYKIIVILKGAYTSITTPDGLCYFNSTGNPGMATAGSGDVLTGILTALLAQRYSPIDAALLGVYVHGLAGDIALENQSEESLISSDIINNLGKAFNYIKKYNK